MSAPKSLPAVYWLTRDSIFGELSSRIDVWAVRPVRTPIAGGDFAWLAPEDIDVDTEDTCLGDWSIAEARLEVHSGIPETSRECIVVGRPPREPARERLAS